VEQKAWVDSCQENATAEIQLVDSKAGAEVFGTAKNPKEVYYRNVVFPAEA